MDLVRIVVFFAVICCPFLGRAQFEEYSSRTEYLSIFNEMSLDEVRSALLDANVHGLLPSVYWSEAEESAYQQGRRDDPEFKKQVGLKYLQFLRDLSLGIVDPATMGPDVSMRRKGFLSPPQLRAVALVSGNSARVLATQMAPQNELYLGLKESLRRMQEICAQGRWTRLPSFSGTLGVGKKDPAVVAIKERLRLLGYPMTSMSDEFDKDVLAAVNDIQINLKMKPDGKITSSGKTINYLEVSCQSRIQQIRADMEKMRWFPQNFEDRHIFVNLSSSQFNLIDKTHGNMSFRAINGRTQRPTPTMKDRVVQVVINPYWVVPPTIFKEDKVEEIRNLTSSQINDYFASRNYEVWNSNLSRKLDPSSIDWWSVGGDSPDILIRQKPHTGNALGVLKFMLTNSLAIYLHDTNQPELFSEASRQLSSGCVRLEKPFDLAEYLLRGTEWTREVIEHYAAKPGQVMENDTKIALEQPTPVYLIFLTSQMSTDGVIRFMEDTYQQNSRIWKSASW